MPMLKSLLRHLSGSAYALAGDTLVFYEQCERENGVVRSHCWGLPFFVVTDPLVIEDLFIHKKDCFVKSAGLRANRRAFGQSLLTSDGALWQRQRQIMQPAFRPTKLGAYWPALEATMHGVLTGWGSAGAVDVHKEMTDLCFEALAVPLFGEDMTAVRPLVVEAAAALHDFHQSFSREVAIGGLAVAAIRGIATLLGHPDFFFDPSWLPTKYAKRFRQALDRLDDFVYAFIERRASEPARDDLMSMLLTAKDESGAPLSRRQIRDEIVTMFFAGHETGAASISWTLYLLARHPDVARRLAAAPAGGSYVHQVVHESMRLFPPAYRVSRTVIRSCELGAMKVPRGAEVVIPQWAVHRSPRLFREPNAFQPERWTAELTKKLPKFAYFPFGGGQRVCIGNHFGLQESLRVVWEVNRRFEMRLAKGAKADPVLGVTLLPREGSLRIEYRRRRSVAELGAGSVISRPTRDTETVSGGRQYAG
jgi:cytochrome P450